LFKLQNFKKINDKSLVTNWELIARDTKQLQKRLESYNSVGDWKTKATEGDRKFKASKGDWKTRV